jgi:hypothetical protein
MDQTPGRPCLVRPLNASSRLSIVTGCWCATKGPPPPGDGFDESARQRRQYTRRRCYTSASTGSPVGPKCGDAAIGNRQADTAHAGRAAVGCGPAADAEEYRGSGGGEITAAARCCHRRYDQVAPLAASAIAGGSSSAASSGHEASAALGGAFALGSGTGTGCGAAWRSG